MSWEAAGFAAEAVRGAQESVQRAANDATPARSVGDIEWTVTGQPVTRDMLVDPATGVVRSTHTARIRQLLPRFTADELDDVDHSQSTKLDSAPLQRGKLPTAGQISKYREVMARRSSTVTEALKASGIDCEVAQYVLERWAGGLSDIQACGLVVAIVDRAAAHVTRAAIDARARVWLTDRRPALDITEPTDDSAQRRREEREAQRQRMAALQAQLAVERAARTAEPQPEPTRFDLLECDPAADPAASIAAWEARQKRSAVHSMPQSLPQPGHRRPFEVVDAEAEGLRTGAAFTALLGRALNPNC